MQNIKNQITYFILAANSLYENDHLTPEDIKLLKIKLNDINKQLFRNQETEITLSAHDILSLCNAAIILNKELP